MRRFSIFTLMIVVCLLGVAVAAMRNANPVWAGVMLLASLLLMGTALLGVIYGEGRPRAGWMGFALFAGCYLTLAFGPWLAESVGEKLPTTQLLHHVHSQVVTTSQVVVLSGSTASVSTMGGDSFQIFAATGGQPLSSGVSMGPTQPQGVNRWKIFFPGASNYEPFHQVGHCLFALMAGLTGALIARRFHAARERRQAAAADAVAAR